MTGVVIIGGGQAGHSLAVSLRECGYQDAVTVVESEGALPYQRPPLSKEYLFAPNEPADVALVSGNEYRDLGITFRPGVTVKAVDRVRREVILGSGGPLPYHQLVLATGVRARPLDVPGLPLDGVHTLRSLTDARRLRRQLASASDVVVIGAGFIGLEIATGAAQPGRRVTVLEAAPRILQRSLSSATAAFLSDRHTENGVEIKTGASVRELLGDDRVTGVRLGDGQVLRAAVVVVGIGVVPNIELAATAGIEADHNGFVVDEFLRTSDPSIYAIGDAASFESHFATGRARVESVQNAIDQGRCLARTLSGNPCRYEDLPWFWSHQAGHLVQIAGIGRAHDAAYVCESGDPRRFSTFCYRAGTLIAVESVDQPRIHMQARRLLAAGVTVPPDLLAEPDTLDTLRQWSRAS